MRTQCSRCGMESFTATAVCPACLGPIETVSESSDAAISNSQNNGGGFWTVFLILCGLGLLMQVSALFL